MLFCGSTGARVPVRLFRGARGAHDMHIFAEAQWLGSSRGPDSGDGGSLGSLRLQPFPDAEPEPQMLTLPSGALLHEARWRSDQCCSWAHRG